MNERFSPIQLEPAYRKVAAVLLERITARAFNDGDRLPSETELADQFGVNRSTVREALRELQTKGLLRRQRGSKLMMVTRPERDLVAEGVSQALVLHDVTFLHVWESMSMFEPSIAQAAAQHRTAADLAALDAIEINFVRSKDDTPRCVHQVAEFFGAIAEATHNPVLVLSQQPLVQLLEPSLGAMIDEVPQARSRIATAHRKVIEAIRIKNPDEARLWMTKHIRDFRRGYEVAGIDLNHRVSTKQR